jgi:hypothetical protein
MTVKGIVEIGDKRTEVAREDIFIGLTVFV